MDQTDRSVSPFGRGLFAGGYVLIAMSGGMALGYWASDWQIRFFPTLVAGMFLLTTCGFALFAFGARILTARLGRRVRLYAGLGLSSLLGLGATLVMGRQTPLTAMAESELRYAHELDARYFRDLDRNLRGVVAELESEHGLFRSEPPRSLTAEEEALVIDAWASYLDTALALDRIRRFHEDFYRFDLSRLERNSHVRSFLLSFAAELSLYENTTRLIEVLDGNENVVRFLNAARPDRGIEVDSVAAIREELSGLTDLSRVVAGRRYLSYLETVHQAKVDAMAERYDWLWNEVDRYLASVERRRRSEVVTLSAASDFAPILRELKHLSFPVQKEIAQWMGNVRLKRPGKYLVTQGQARAMERELAPGDVLLARKNWYLSNIGLPGFWPHGMLYIGKNEVIASTFDEDEAVLAWTKESTGRDLPFTDLLRETYPLAWHRRELAATRSDPLTIIEAVSEGVVQSTLYGASGDFIVALRPRLSSVAKARAILRTFSYLGRPYDFDFDFATDQTLVCTEVLWRAYRGSAREPGLALTPISVAGRMTLPPNEIARMFAAEYGTERAQLDFVYYLEGREQQARAVEEGVEAFLRTPERSKWDFGPL